jgi:hypothetical protein
LSIYSFLPILITHLLIWPPQTLFRQIASSEGRKIERWIPPRSIDGFQFCALEWLQMVRRPIDSRK